jgi:hypothetical protein
LQDYATVGAEVWQATISPALLQAALTSCGFPAADISAAVTAALAQYYDIFTRDALNDTGVIPYPMNMVCASPDIIPSGLVQVPNPGTYFTGNWNQDVGINVTQGATNFIYVRGQNLFNAPNSGNIFLYYTPASLLLKPSIWTKNQIPVTAPGISPAAYASSVSDTNPQGQQIVVGSQPFQWAPSAPPVGDHYCLISQVVTTDHPNAIPGDDSLQNFVQWVRDNPAIAWRNVSLVPPQIPQQTVGFSNPEPQAEGFVFAIEVSGLPIGSNLVISAAPGAPFAPQTLQITSNPQTFGFPANQVPAGYTGTVTCTYSPPPGGAPVPVGAQISISYLAVPSQSNGLMNYGRPAMKWRLNRNALGLAQGGNLVFLGNFIFEVSS